MGQAHREGEGEKERSGDGPITRFLVEDHRRLDALLQSAVANPDQVDHAVYDQFRAGLLRHIGMEEKILLPAVQRRRGGEPLPIASKLRVDHGAIASLLMPTPTAPLIAMIRKILADHNVIEEGRGGFYEICETLLAADALELLGRLEAAPRVSMIPYSDTPTMLSTVRRAVERAGYEYKG